MKFISLGNNCFSAAILKLYNLRDCSFMFDWSLTTVDKVINILNNYSIDNCDELIENKLVEFVHHSDLSYRKRCIERFFNVLASNEEKVFLLTLFDDFDKEQIIYLTKMLREKTTNFKLICIDLVYNKEFETHELELENMSEYFEYWSLKTNLMAAYPSGTREGILKYKIFYKIFKKYLNLSLDDIFSNENIEKEVKIYPLIGQEKWNLL